MRAGLLSVVILLLAACAGAPSPSPNAAPDEQVRILATELWADLESPFAVAAATDRQEWDALRGKLGLQAPQPEVDFERELVLFLGMAGSSSCPERFAGLVIDQGSRVYAEWIPPAGDQPCTDDLAAQGLLLAVDRTLLPSEPFAFTLREQPVCPDCQVKPDQMVVDPR